MVKKNILIISCIIFSICCVLLIWFLLITREGVLYVVSTEYPSATMDMLIEDAQYIALVKVLDDGNRVKVEQDVTKADGTVSKETYINIDTNLKILESYKGTFDSDEIIYRNSNGAVITNDEDHPNFVKGEELILFMCKEPQTNTYYLYYGIQGAFRFNDIEEKYINSNNVKFSNMKEEINTYNNKPLEEREILPKRD